MKKCSKCRIAQPYNMFRRRVGSKHHKDGYSGWCKPCERASRQAYNKTEAGLRSTLNHRTTPVFRWHLLLNAAKTRGLPVTITRSEWAKLVIGRQCSYCDVPLDGAAGSSTDRLDPALGYTAENCVPCCGVCNVVRGRMFSASQMRELGEVIKVFRDRDGFDRLSARVKHGKRARTVVSNT